jgi:hypothetical protein
VTWLCPSCHNEVTLIDNEIARFECDAREVSENQGAR